MDRGEVVGHVITETADIQICQYDLGDSNGVPAEDAKQVRKTADDEPETWPKSIPEIERIWRHARSLDCDYVRFDGDGPVDPNLPHWDWSGR